MRAEVANSHAPLGWSRNFVLILPLLLALMLGLFAVSATPQAKHTSSASSSATSSNLNALVRDILQNELRAQADDHSLWCYRKLTDKDGKQQLFAACQTKTLEIDRLMAVNGKPLTEQQWNQENQRIERLLNNRSQLKKEKQQQREDGEQATNLLRMVPDAFLFQQESNEGNRITLHFTPNPAFRASGSSEMVFHHMEGTLTLDVKQKRLVEISGRLNSEVKFAGGLLGHLDKGGTFYVKQQEVGPGCWEMTRMDVQMNGKALFFKTISVRTREIDTDFYAVPAAASIQQVAALTNESGEKRQIREQR
ncbi:MAG TPA: hypothetical protein VK818_17875 [Methylomirabilota bacterium]|jgi:hypothetical protein|nr:hypothetical protein [Methylomirabilota bacterium]